MIRGMERFPCGGGWKKQELLSLGRGELGRVVEIGDIVNGRGGWIGSDCSPPLQIQELQGMKLNC